MIKRRLIAPPNAGRLDVWLSEQVDQTRSRLRNLIRSGSVTVNGKCVKPSYAPKEGDVIETNIPEVPSTDIKPENIPLDIRFIDDDIIVVNKPAGMVVHPAESHPGGTLANAIVHLISDMEGSDPKRPGIVHRIDKGTSGLLVIARTERAMQCLSTQFADHSIHRRYLALIWGDKHPDKGKIEAAIGRNVKDRKKMAVREDGKHAVTHYKLQAIGRPKNCIAGGGVSLIECRLETGRTHQIRVHMAAARQAIVGDPVYGRKKAPNAAWRNLLKDIDRQMLHAWQLGFIHPNGKEMRFSVEPPNDFRELLHQTQIKMPNLNLSD